MDPTPPRLLKDFSVGGHHSHFGQVTYPPGGTHGPLRQKAFQVVGILEGSMRVEVDAESYEVREHEACLLLPGQRIFLQFDLHTPTEHTWGSIGVEGMPEDLPGLLEPWHGTMSLHLYNLVAWALELGHDPVPGLSLQLHSLGICLMREMYRIQQLQKGGVQDERISKALQFMHAHCEEEIGVEDVARHAALSRQHLNRLFREKNGESLSRHLWRIRTEKARRLILETGLSLTEISDRCGFQNPFHLSRKIREQYGKSPRDLRRTLWGDV